LGGLVHRVVRTIGVEQQARQVRRALQPRWRRRNLDDDEQLRRLLLLGLRSDSHCIDVGANVGVILGWMEAAAPRGRHIAFEPVPVLNRRLAERHPSVDVRADAVSDEAGTATFTVVRDAMSRSGLDPLGVPSHAATEQIEVRTVRLDDVLPDDFHPRLIKIDVEGTELQALKGARSTLASHDLLLALEHGHGSAEPDLARSAELYDLLRGECRMRVFDMRGNEFDAAGFRTAYLSGSCWNFLARR
jgi:FkbM family methyltransferase